MMQKLYEQAKKLIDEATTVVVIQADNPDADSLGSALALEQILHDLDKKPSLYCGVDIPDYLKHMPGWDRVSKDMPSVFELSIIVDTGAISLLEKLESSPMRGWVASRPCLVLDHHGDVLCDIPYATVAINDSSKVSTGELIYDLAGSLKWSVNLEAKTLIMSSILADSQGLTTENTTANSYRVMADLVEAGVNRPKLEELRRAYNKMPPSIFQYKAELITRTELLLDGRLAFVVIPQDEINRYSPLYNPNALIQSEHLQIEGVVVSVSLKTYQGGRVTAAIRCGLGAPIAAKLASYFKGDGHAYAAGFKIENSSLEVVKKNIIDQVTTLLGGLEGEA